NMIKPSEIPLAASSDDSSSHGLIRRLSRRYLLVLSAVAVLIVLDQAVVQPLLVRLNTYAPVINIAGRQRMLSQKLAKVALELQLADEEQVNELRRDELRVTLHRWTRAHTALLERNADKLSALEPQFMAMSSAAQVLIKTESTAANPQAQASTRAAV